MSASALDTRFATIVSTHMPSYLSNFVPMVQLHLRTVSDLANAQVEFLTKRFEELNWRYKNFDDRDFDIPFQQIMVRDQIDVQLARIDKTNLQRRYLEVVQEFIKEFVSLEENPKSSLSDCEYTAYKTKYRMIVNNICRLNVEDFIDVSRSDVVLMEMLLSRLRQVYGLQDD
jgi:hypothetical protein